MLFKSSIAAAFAVVALVKASTWSQSTSTSASGTSNSATSASSGSTSSSSSSETISYQQFCDCVAAYSKTTSGGTPPTPSEDTYNDFVKYGATGLSLNEQAMLLANVIWETGGMQYLVESGCSDGSCSYGQYYGRGYLQLTWQDNYSSASSDIFGNDSLVQSPDQAADNPAAWQTASWYWNSVVHPSITDSVLSSYDLGTSIKLINGAIECVSPCQYQPQNRLTIYNSCLSTLGISGTGSISSCCT